MPGEIHSVLNYVADSVGAPLLVVLFYWFRFNSLRGTQSYTTSALYYLGLATFIVPFVLIYFFLRELNPLAAVWLLIAFWLAPILPEAWRSFCQRIAQIPAYAHSLQAALAVAPFELRPADLPAIHRKVARFGYHPDDFQAVQSTFIQSRFLKITAIMYHLEQWDRKKEPFMERNNEHYSELRHSYDLLSFKAVRALRYTSAIHGAIMDDSKVEPDDWQALASSTQDNKVQSAARDAAGCMLEDLRKDMDFLLDTLFLFVARAVLASEWSSAAYRRRLETIGFKLARPISGITQAIISAVTVSLVWTLIWLIPLVSQGFDNKPAAIARVFILPSLNLTLNFLIVYYCKRKFAFANEASLGRLPIEFILSVGFLSALVMFPFRALFDYYQFAPEQFTQALVGGLLLSIFPWGTGAVTALLVQQSIWDAFKSERVKRILDGVTFGACFVLLILVISTINRVWPIPQMQHMPPLWMFLSSFGFGFVIGYLVIARVRDASSLRAFGQPARNRILASA